MLDSVIRGGTVVDGTGAPGRRADVGIRDGHIVEIGDVKDDAAETVDAGGLVVAPGIVDPHTHYDAQLFWDPAASPSNLHGVTSMIAGNCGFTLAPIAPVDADYLRRMMAKVEGMPLPALETGVPWSWQTFADYLGALDGRVALNVGFMVGHCALRRNVMGAGSVGNEATPEQLDAITALLHESLAAGGLGFSTTLSFTHSDGDGQPVAFALGEQRRSARAVPRSERARRDDARVRDRRVPARFQRRRSRAHGGDDAGRSPPAQLERAHDRLARAAALPRPGRGLRERPGTGRHGGRAHHADPRRDEHVVPQLLRALHDAGLVRRHEPPGSRAHREAARSRSAQVDGRAGALPEAGVFSRLASWGRYMIGDTYSAANEGLKGKVVAKLAAERGQSEFDTLVDVVINDDLRTVLWPLPSDSDTESWKMRAEAWDHPLVMIGGSDAGAHLDRMCGAPYPTKFLGDCLRGRKLVSMERCVQLMTQVPAALFGLRDRGTIRAGNFADLFVFDPETVNTDEVKLVDDLPGGTSRLFADSIGVNRVIVNGTTIVIDGVATDARPGTVLRSGRDTYTVPIPADA